MGTAGSGEVGVRLSQEAPTSQSPKEEWRVLVGASGGGAAQAEAKAPRALSRECKEVTVQGSVSHREETDFVPSSWKPRVGLF